MEKKKSGETMVLGLKHDVSVEFATCATTEVPPDPKAVPSLTCTGGDQTMTQGGNEALIESHHTIRGVRSGHRSAASKASERLASDTDETSLCRCVHRAGWAELAHSARLRQRTGDRVEFAEIRERLGAEAHSRPAQATPKADVRNSKQSLPSRPEGMTR